MVIAYVLVNTYPGKEEEVAETIGKIDGVVEMYTLFGEYDMIVKLESKSYPDIESLVIRKIRPIKGILDTKTLTVVSM